MRTAVVARNRRFARPAASCRRRTRAATKGWDAAFARRGATSPAPSLTATIAEMIV
jgi:hypothetical protein